MAEAIVNGLDFDLSWHDSPAPVLESPASLSQPACGEQLKPKNEGNPPSAYIKRLVKRAAQEIRLLQFNPHKEISIKPSDVLSIQRVLGWSELMLI